MKLSQKAIERVSGNRTVILGLALALGFTELWINKLIAKNKEDGKLTTVKALQIISQETGLLEDEILEIGTTVEQ